MPKSEMDPLDRSIVRQLQKNARIPNASLAEEVGLSPSPCLRRVKRLEEDGLIVGYTAVMNETAVGLPVSVFVNVSLKEQSEGALEQFETAVQALPEVMECYLMTGDADYLLRVVAEDLAAFERFLIDHLTRIPVIASIKSSFSLKRVAFRTTLPL